VIALPAKEAAVVLGVEAVNAPVTRVSTDTRDLLPGDLFVALVGERYNGHAFVPAAFAAGASGAVVEMGRSITGDPDWNPPAGAGLLYRVPDSLRALGALARAVRRKSGSLVIAVTGSVGKTGTKDLLRAMVATVCPVIATEANQNNDVGVPITLLRMEADTRVTIVEMGMRARGEIHRLAQVAEPDVGLITRLAPVHLETLVTLEEVASAKAELMEGLRPGGRAVIPAGSELLEPLVAAAGRAPLRFALLPDDGRPVSTGLPEADVTGRVLTVASRDCTLQLCWPGGQTVVHLPFAARHRLENAVAATAACYAAGLPVAECAAGLSTAVFTPGRGDEIRLGGMLVLDDCYNANPVSMRASLDWLAQRASAEGRRPVAVLGDMLELGDRAEAYHRELGAYVAQVGVELLWVVGTQAQAMLDGFGSAGTARKAEALVDAEDGLDALLASLDPDDAILIKASRGVRLERVVEALKHHFGSVPGWAPAGARGEG
jgi:UDP-N-acetylmuramoyl-tripeptide--D-alanyl-D-alanine ligase